MKIFKKGFLMLLILFVVGGMSYEAQAQNPKQTKKRKKMMKKMKKAKEAYEYKKPAKPDDDGDGVPNYYDHCPHTPFSREYEVTSVGCPPDSDGDKIWDYEDKCPEEKGPRENVGCPWGDKDNDGLLDKDDDCPDDFGLFKHRGCPDTDGDDIVDKNDKCPDVPGLKGLSGCPREAEDTDGDGIKNKEDVCPLVPGVVENHGCPEIKPEEKEALKAAFENLLFETNKDIIKESSYSSLNELAKVMINNPAMKLHLEGHTDNQGDDASNMELSQKRAEAVKNYLVKREVAEHRITTIGYGETKPVDTNDTDEGRRKNRRVEMTLKY